ncbi:MAG: rod shape-determining protein MreC [Gammaproteobacteria bacterium]|nr:MAG: rod shape-determining protein MreC [Pseudomonadota bacterium]PIE38906.1 MAG: rod shape-determining protein MreC [Gammaproteobacteria bacterium]
MMVVIVSVALMIMDYRFERVSIIRHAISTLITPVQWVSDLPASALNWGGSSIKTREQLLDENDALQVQIAVLERKLQRLVFLAAENNRLRELLNASSVVEDSVIVSEMIGVNPDPYVHEVVINKGQTDGVRVGHAVVDANGLMGQVIQVSEYTARVLLISDSSHAVPVQVNRNGLRAIVVGKGAISELELANVPDTADIRQGDLLVSSGLGGRFPAGYPVATVKRVEHDPGRPFAHVLATPSARLNQSRLVLVLFKDARKLAAAQRKSDGSKKFTDKKSDSEYEENESESESETEGERP